ncbi:YkoF family thiamine/hydroxymethylpyrimidine-binding protein [Lentibacillus sp.]|uniref:YkoF family thiamine/hydroxymethylpyrimidine-binding protein n=1 Tax=Lentibacillus sp. TaxID=1925746 RepID=UPI002B4B57C2|nr:YkoF family thiamine/hydroxymethylpyrimidine-binding protein [Lentibacillus sp.]HLS07510.1 YkoF family thiamine/hydroxymethylpyrimidine-binding protein [Lentibacillus sp.]
MTRNSCGTSRITGCQFTLFPMSDKFVDIILGSLDEVDTSKVWKDTDDVSTCVRGKMVHVFDVVKALFLHAAKTGEHVAMSGTFSIGCPGDTEADSYMDETDTPLNEAKSSDITQEAGCKFSLYPMGREDYMDAIYEQIDLSKQRGVEVSHAHYATRLDGDVKDIFRAMVQSFDSVQQKVSHVIMSFTISANSPSNKT